MSQYTPIDNENLLIKRQSAPINIHEYFYNHHVMNVLDFDDGDLVYDNSRALLESMRRVYPEQLAKMKDSLDKLPIYKYIDIRNLKYWLIDKRLYWDRISDSWEDPYENYFLKENFITEDGTPFTADNNIPGVFGQSWTLREETDAMWRIYSKECKTGGKNNTKIYYGVRIETTARKLLDIIYACDSSMADTWIGKVKYLTETEIDDTLKEGITDIQNALAESFFNKRKEFDHESEFRAVKLMDSNTISNTEKFKRIAFSIPNIDDFIDNFVLDPRLSIENFNILKDELVSYGVKPEKIIISSLYSFRPVTVKMNN